MLAFFHLLSVAGMQSFSFHVTFDPYDDPSLNFLAHTQTHQSTHQLSTTPSLVLGAQPPAAFLIELSSGFRQGFRPWFGTVRAQAKLDTATASWSSQKEPLGGSCCVLVTSSDALGSSSFLLLVVRPGATVASLLLKTWGVGPGMDLGRMGSTWDHEKSTLGGRCE